MLTSRVRIGTLACCLTLLALLTGCPPTGGSNNNNGDGDQNTGTPAPSALEDVYSTNQSALIVADSAGVLANDIITLPATVTAFDAATTGGGSVSVRAGGGFTYTSSAGFSGVDTFTYTVTDAGGSSQGTVRITVTPTPVPRDDAYSTNQSPLVVPASSGLLANDTLTSPATVTSFDTITTSGGIVTVLTNGGFTYLPPAGLNAVDTFTYTVTDALGSARGAARITVALPTPPVEIGGGTPGGPPIDGGTADDSLTGTAGGDTIAGKEGNDTVDAGLGDDIVEGDFDQNSGSLGSTGSDILIGGSGTDRVIGDVTVNLLGATITRTGDDILDGGPGTDTLLGDGVINNGTIDRTGGDLINGGTGDDRLYGDFQLVSSTASINTCGSDVLFGGDGADLLLGDAEAVNGVIATMGNDTLNGGKGADALYGDTLNTFGSVTKYGDDVLEGGEDDDTLVGDSESITVGGGADTFVFSILGSFGNDRIRDCRASESDVVRFTGVSDADGNGAIERTDLDLLFTFGFEAFGSNPRVVVTRRSDSVVLGSIAFENIAFGGQSSFVQLNVTVQVAP